MFLPDTEEDKPFLDGHDGGECEHTTPSRRYRCFAPLSITKHGALLVCQVAVLALHVFLLFFTTFPIESRVHCRTDNTLPSEPFSPAQETIQYTIEDLHYHMGPSAYTGDPRPEVDEAWSSLLRSTMVKVSEDEMRRMNKTSVTLADGSGYVGYLEAHHMLHCVKRIYQSQYPDHYSDLESDGFFTTAHLHHCIDVLREGIMCNADVMMNTFFWQSPSAIKGDRSGSRKCVNWDRIQAWADERALNASIKDEFIKTLVPSHEVGTLGPLE